MALKSMTGYGEGIANGSGFRITAEISSVNRKQLDIQISLPKVLQKFESEMHTKIRTFFSRGRISGNVRVEVTKGSAKNVVVDEKLAQSYLAALKRLSVISDKDSDVSLETLIQMPDVLQVEASIPDIDNLFVLFSRALEAALRALKKMRLAEGKELEDDLRKRLSYLEKYRSELLLNAPKLAKTYSARLLARLEKSEMNGWEKDERVLREVALFADRSDITEELTRLQSHHKQMLKHFRSKEPAGRPLDFLCQEAFREINTVASKATDPNITKIVVQYKTELERMREQIQNVE